MLKQLRRLFVTFFVVCLLPMAAAWAGESLTGVAVVKGDDGVRITLALSAPVKYYVTTLPNPDRVVVDLVDTRLRAALDSVPLDVLRRYAVDVPDDLAGL